MPDVSRKKGNRKICYVNTKQLPNGSEVKKHLN